MTILLFLFGVAVAAGLFFILADILKLPRLSTEKALLSAGRTEKKRMKSLDALFLGWAIKLSKYIRMDEYKRHRLERTLNAAGMDMTPEVYLAYTILKPAAALLAVIPCLLIFPLLSPIVVLLAILLYFKESRKAEEKVTERREKIEGELPRFVATVEQELGASRDVLTILENYKRHAGPDFARELDVLTADMRSSSYEAALVRFEGRLASPMLSDIVRGLIGVLRGDDGRIYFQMLSHDMKQLELQQLKAQAAKIPPKIRVYSFVTSWLSHGFCPPSFCGCVPAAPAGVCPSAVLPSACCGRSLGGLLAGKAHRQQRKAVPVHQVHGVLLVVLRVDVLGLEEQRGVPIFGEALHDFRDVADDVVMAFAEALGDVPAGCHRFAVLGG